MNFFGKMFILDSVMFSSQAFLFSSGVFQEKRLSKISLLSKNPQLLHDDIYNQHGLLEYTDGKLKNHGEKCEDRFSKPSITFAKFDEFI